MCWDLKIKSDLPGRAQDGGDGPGTPGSESEERKSGEEAKAFTHPESTW